MLGNFQQAIQWMKEGKKVRRKDWGNKKLRGRLDNDFIFFDDESGKCDSHFLNVVSSIEANDWEIYEEEKLTFEDIEEGRNEFLKLRLDAPNRIKINKKTAEEIIVPNSLFGMKVEIDEGIKDGDFELRFEKEEQTLSDFIMPGRNMMYNGVGVNPIRNYLDKIKKPILAEIKVAEKGNSSGASIVRMILKQIIKTIDKHAGPGLC